ncbi:hypothetical protein ACILG0_11650 [Pseudomonadota bacterium AL_CKDN230030165-1A_HGKHYDSX7]
MLDNKMMPVLMSIGVVALMFVCVAIYVSVAPLSPAQVNDVLKTMAISGLCIPPVLAPAIMIYQRRRARKRAARETSSAAAGRRA